MTRFAGLPSVALALLLGCDRGEPMEVAREAEPAVAPRVVPSAPAGFPLPHRPCLDGPDEETCLLERYRRDYWRLQGKEIGGVMEMLGEGFESIYPLVVAATPSGPDPTQAAACDRLARTEVAVQLETLTRPQRDCFFACLGPGTDAAACARQQRCASLPAMAAAWSVVLIVPRLACLEKQPVPARCAQLPVWADSEVAGRVACSPRARCKAHDTRTPSPDQRFVLVDTPDTCALRPLTAWCAQTRMELPRARCAFGP